jgi:Fe(3+) dicitrate transport protein
MKAIYSSGLILFTFIGISLAGFSENIDRGVYGVVQSKGEAAPFITVYLKGTNIGTSTDAEGRFVLTNLPEGEVILRVQGIGYKAIEQIIHIEEGMFELILEMDQDNLMLEQVLISGSRVGLLRYLPGSAGFIEKQELKSIMPLSGNDVFRTITGIHVVEEEGIGLRANIGIRGLDPDKSRNVLILEDGIPVALGPYGEPEMYYTPSIDRMSGIEVLKGNGSILFGPQTIGGVINYLTPDPPAGPVGTVSVRGGEFGFFTGQLGYGTSFGNSGIQINYLRKQADDFGPTMFRVNDFTSKFRIRINPSSQLNVKLGVYDETSNSTYIGLTQPMYDLGENDFLRIAPDDMLDVRRYSLSATHEYSLADGVQLSTTVFGYTTTRNWNRQDFTYSSSASNLTGVVHGDPALPGGAIYMRNSTGQRNRQFEVAGIEPRLKYRYKAGEKESTMDVGVRFLYERAFEQRVNGTKAGVLSGTLRDDEIRTGRAVSSYAQNKILLNDKFSLTAGIRTETIWYNRNIMRVSATDTLIMEQSNLSSLIPGAGLNYNFNENFGIFAGIHRGFAPPRIKDAISNEGVDLQLEAEKSWNSELGVRGKITDYLELEITAFHMDFSNQVIPVSESSGGRGTGYINGGATLHYGLETGVILSLINLFSPGWNTSLLVNSTLINAEFSDDRFVIQKTGMNGNTDTVMVNIKGNKTPYAPPILLSGAFILESPRGFGIRLSGRYTGSQYTDVLNTKNVIEWFDIAAADTDFTYVQASADGRIGELSAFFVADGTIWVSFPEKGIELSACVKNIFNERYIASRRPQGIRVGMPRYFSFGLNYSF